MEKEKEIRNVFLPAIIVFVVFIIFFNFIAKPIIVSGESMEPTLNDGQWLFINKLDTNIERYDIVVAKVDDIYIIKRVIGMPGENVKIKDNDIYINGQKIQDITNVKMTGYGLLRNGVTLKSNEYILLGDNRNNSLDSRTLGAISIKNIEGKIFKTK